MMSVKPKIGRPGWISLLLSVLLVAGLLLPAWGVQPAAADSFAGQYQLLPANPLLPAAYSNVMSVCALWVSPQGTLWVAYQINGYDLPPQLYTYASGVWTQIPVPSGWMLWISGISGLSDNEVWAVTPYGVNGGDIQMWNGKQWSGQIETSDNGYNSSAVSLWVYDAGHVYATCSNKELYQLTGSATNYWTALSSMPGGPGFYMWGSSPNDIYVASGAGNQLYHYDGTTWSTPFTDSGWDIEDVWGLSASDVYVSDSKGIAHYDGTSWTLMPGSSKASGGAIAGTADNDIFAAMNSHILYYDGTAWTDYPAAYQFDFAAVAPDGSIFLGDSNSPAVAQLGGSTPVSAVGLSKTADTIVAGANDTLTATLQPPGATDQNVTWTTSDPSVASIVYGGLDCTVTGVAPGSATITVTSEDGGFTANCAVTVNASVPVTAVNLSIGQETLDVGDSDTVTAAIGPSDASDQNVTWTTSDPSVASIVYGGLDCTFTAKAQGTATITCTTEDGGKTASCTITVQPAVTGPTVPVTGISLSASSAIVQLQAGNSFYSLTATVEPSDATDQTVTWTSSNPAVATVNSSGLVTALSPGTATITATSEGGSYSASCVITVAPAVPATGIAAVQSSLTMPVGASLYGYLLFTVSPSTASYPYYSLASSNPAVVTVGTMNATTAIQALAPGTATLTATTADGSDLSATCTVTVNTPGVPVTGVSLSGANRVLYPGDAKTLTATFTPGNASDQGLIWTSNDPSVATVDQTGQVTVVSNGAMDNGSWGDTSYPNATITATSVDGQHSATFAVSVVPAGNATGIALSKTTDTLTTGGSDTLTATMEPAGASSQGLTWSSSNTAVATVNSSGLVTALAPGTATITAFTYEGANTGSPVVSTTCSVTVAPAGGVTGIALSKTTDTLTTGGSDTLTASLSPAGASSQGLAWTTSNSSVASVVYNAATGNATITAVGPGTATITCATSYGVQATCTVTVNAPMSGSAAYDLNGDGQVNVLDLILVGQHFGQTGAPGWIPEDVNQDGAINVLDLLDIYQHFTS